MRATRLGHLAGLIAAAVVAQACSAPPDVKVPNLIRVALEADLPVPTNEVTPVPWTRVATLSGSPPAELTTEGDIQFGRDCWCTIEIHMDWPVAAKGALRRMDVLMDLEGDEDPRLAATTVGRGSGDGYSHSSTGLMWFPSGSLIRVDVKQNSGSPSYLQATNLTWLIVTEFAG